jgi:signal transduction histidine kinase
MPDSNGGRGALTAPHSAKPPLLALGLLGIALVAIALGVGLIDRGLTGTLYGFLGLAVGEVFIAVGLYAWWRRPSNLIGPLMVGTGFSWLMVDVAYYGGPTVFTLGSVLGALYYATAVHLLLAFPSGRLETPAAKLAALSGYLIFFGGNLLVWLVADIGTQFECSCPRNVIQVIDDETLADVVVAVTNLLAVAVVAYVLVRLLISWRQSQGWRRRAMTPLLFAGAATAFLLGLIFLFLSFNRSVDQDVLTASIAAFGLVPFAFLLGLARSAILGRGALGELVGDLTEARDSDEAREALRRALGDPSLELAFRQPDGEDYVDADGRPVTLPGPGGVRSFAPVNADGEAVAAIVFDAMLVDDPQLVEAVSTTAALAIEKHKLDAELRAKLEELRASRERIVEAASDERRRLERNLHDGAQQRLVSLALELRMARDRLGSDTQEAGEMLDAAAGELEVALGELRELARGIHPAILSDRGLGAALESLAARTPFEVEIEAVPSDRLPENVELAAYLLVSEALANSIKHARANRATVNVTQDNGRVTVEIADDGVGGADPAKGSGLRGLVDRVSALGGSFECDSQPGHGTSVRASIPSD